MKKNDITKMKARKSQDIALAWPTWRNFRPVL